jgi:tetratricopeptide (TPR) repeat protein
VPGQPVCTDCGKTIPASSGTVAGSEDAGSAAEKPTPSKPARGKTGGSTVSKRNKKRDFDLVGRVIAEKYKVLDVLGQGGFGTVFLVEITAGMVGEKLALKILPEELSRMDSFRTQFLNEIRVAMRLVDRHIVQIRDVGTTSEGLLYYTMDFCPGTTLAQVLRREGRLPITRAVVLVLNVLRGLQTAHAAGIIHRDLKPANIMVEEQGGKETVRVLDFGIATALSGEQHKGFAGSPPYMPPEQFVGAEIGFFTDVYAIGVILYECITGQKPHPGSTPKEVYNSLKSRAVTPPEKIVPEVASFRGLSELILRCLERNPERRYQSGRELFDALNAILVSGTQVDAAPAQPAPAARRPSRSAARPRPAARQAAGRIRRHRSPAKAPRAGSRVMGFLLAVVIVAGVVLAVAFNQQIRDWWRSIRSHDVTSGQPEAGSNGSPGAAEPNGTKPEAGVSTPDPDAGMGPPDGTRRGEDDQALARSLERLEKAYKDENWAEVLGLAEAVLKRKEDQPRAHHLRGLAALNLGDEDQAVTSLTRARELLGKDAVDAAFLLDLATAHVGSTPPGFAEAEPLLEMVLKENPENVRAWLLLAGIYEQADRLDELRALLSRARRDGVASSELEALYDRYVLDDLRRKRDQARSLLADAREAYGAGKYAESSGLAERSYASWPSPEAALLAAICQVEVEDSTNALESVTSTLARLRETVSREPNSGVPPDLVPARPTPEDITRVEALRDLLQARIALEGLKRTSPVDRGALERVRAALSGAAESLLPEGEDGKDRVAAHLRLALGRLHALEGNLEGATRALAPLSSVPAPDIQIRVARIGLDLADHLKDNADRIEACGLSRGALALVLKGRDIPQRMRAEAGLLVGLSSLQLGILTDKSTYFRQALDGFSMAEAGGAESVRLYESWAEAYDQVGNLIRAAQCLRRAYELDPSPERCLRAVDAYLAANPQSDEARALLRECKVRFQDNEEIQKKK